MPRRICVSTGKRGGFGALVPVMRLLDKDPGLELKVVVTDMHLSKTFGYTADEVQKYVSISECVPLGQAGDKPSDRVQALGRCMSGMAEALSRIKPDIVLLLGDRSETLVTAMASVELGIPVAHIQAGDVSGGLDDLHRHAITKLAHLHFSQTEKQAARVLSLGEEPWRVHVTGAPYVDRIVAGEYPSREQVAKKLELDLNLRTAILLMHSDTYRQHLSYEIMKAALEEVSSLGNGWQTVVCYPCSDPGYAGIIRAIEEIRSVPGVKCFKNVESADFLGLMAMSELMIGNSSSAVIEAPYFNLPAVNIGDRQRNRERADNMIDAGISRQEIRDALAKALSPGFREKLRDSAKPFGDGTASRKIVEIMKSVPLGPALFEKKPLQAEKMEEIVR